MIKLLICMVAGHKLHVAQYKNPIQRVIPPSAMYNAATGEIRVKQLEPIGFLHYGLHSICSRCKTSVEIESCSLEIPILLPDFSAK